jgi:soluble P-type ATPase
MIEIVVPGYKTIEIEHLVLDYNGTLARDGDPLDGVRERLESLAGELTVHVITADTFGTTRDRLEGLPCELVVLSPDGQDAAKADYVRRLGSGRTAAVGNGRNDRLMLQEAELGIVVVQEEGASVDAITAADVACPDIRAALDLLARPLRLAATLRN